MEPALRLLGTVEASSRGGFPDVLDALATGRYGSASCESIQVSTARTKRREPKPVTAAELKETLRKAGLKSTAPRLAALRYLHSTSAPASHAELFAALESDGFDRATLYRNLVDLAEAGIVSRTDLGDHVWRFELRREGGGHSAEHPHFVCSDCGLVSCLPGVAVKIVSTSSAPRAVGKKNVEIQLRGRCDSCT